MKDDRKRDKRGKDGESTVSRRRFLGQASCAAVGTTALFSTALDMSMFNVLAQTTPGDYKALVCLFFGGGIDSYNVVVPAGQAEYDEYAQIRRDLALPQDMLLPIAPATPDGRQYGIHPNMPEVKTLFDAGELAVMANVGTLVEPTNLQQFRSRSVRLPLGLFSHSDQSMHWQTSLPDRRNAIGWAGRMADILYGMNTNPNISMNISLGGNNVFQSGMNTFHYSISQNGSRGLRGYNGTSLNDMVRTEAVDGLLDLTYQNLFERTFANRMRGAIDADVDFSAAIDSLPPLQTQFSDTGLSQQFRMVAQTIQARTILGFRRQTFFISMGGWDHHDEVLLNQENMLPVVSAALSEFQAAMVELQTQNDVTTFTASDFGRTLTSNGRGSDHAWGGNMLLMGGAVRGGDIYGRFPELYEGNSLDTGRGRLIPSTSVDEYFAEMALWFGIPRQDLELVLPNIRRFYDPASVSAPVGYLLGPGQSRNQTPTDRRENRLDRIIPRNSRRQGANRS